MFADMDLWPPTGEACSGSKTLAKAQPCCGSAPIIISAHSIYSEKQGYNASGHIHQADTIRSDHDTPPQRIMPRERACVFDSQCWWAHARLCKVPTTLPVSCRLSQVSCNFVT